jgi:hypothetical protein
MRQPTKSPRDIVDTRERDHVVPGSTPSQTHGTAYILEQEREGQAQLVTSDVIPAQGAIDTPGNRRALEDLGFEIGELTDDKMFVRVKLPKGWTREGSSHAMWSYIVDADGYQRIGCFYKAAFYDRSAHMHIEGEPRTRAQAEAWQTIDRSLADGEWRSGDSRRDGPNYVYAYRGRLGEVRAAQLRAERKSDVTARGERIHEYTDDGRRLEVTVAPDGTELGRREWVVDESERGDV